jgi:MFS family permease
VVCVAAALIAAGGFIAGLFFLQDMSHHRRKKSADWETQGRWVVCKRLLTRSNLLLVLAATFLSQLGGTLLEADLPLLLVNEEHLEILQVLVVFATMAIAVPILLGVVYPWLSARVGNKAVMVLGFGLNALGMILMPLFVWWPIQAALTLLLAWGNIVGPPLELVASFSASRAFGTVAGMARSVGAFARILGPLIAGKLFDVDFTLQKRARLLPFWVGALISCVAVVVCLFMTRTEAKENVSAEK